MGIGCETCGYLACICGIRAAHVDGCKFRLAATCAVPVECPHGRDCCPECDPCTCPQVVQVDGSAPTTRLKLAAGYKVTEL